MSKNRYSHAATLVVIRNGSLAGEIELLAFLYTKHNKLSDRAPFSSWKFPTETGEVGETRWETAANGMVRELCDTPDNPEGFNFRALGPRDRNNEPIPFLVSRVPGDPGKDADWHDKCVFIVHLTDESIDRVRKEEKWDGEDELLDPPEFVEASALWERMLERGQPFHRAVLYRVIEYLAEKNVVVKERYSELIKDRRAHNAVISRGRPIEFI